MLRHYIMGTFLFFLFSFLYAYKKRKNAHKRNQIKKAAFYAHKKHLSWKKPLICLFTFLCFCLDASLCFMCFRCFLCYLCFLWVRNLFVKKKNKGFKTALLTSFTIPPKFILLQAWTFSIKILFNHHINYYNLLYYNLFNHNLFQLSQSSLSESFFNLFTACDTIFMKLGQCINSII